MSMKLGKRFLGAMVVTALVTMSLSFNAFAKTNADVGLKVGDQQLSVVKTANSNFLPITNGWYYMSKKDTTVNGYKYNMTLEWIASPNSVRGYYLAVQDANNPKRWLIKQTCTTNPRATSEDIYGLPANGSYNVYLYALDKDYKLLVEYQGLNVKIGANSNLYDTTELPIQ